MLQSYAVGAPPRGPGPCEGGAAINRLVLFDIDGTLMDSGGAGVRALDHALSRVAGIEGGLDGVEIAGRTDLWIIGEALRRRAPHLIGGSRQRDVMGAYLGRLAEELDAGAGMRLMPGVRDLLEALARTPGLTVGLLTGNARAGAALKLHGVGIGGHFERGGLMFGAFGDDHADRNALLPYATGRYKELHGREVAFADVWVVGDTPHDIECARAHGARALAVATGGHTRRELQGRGADVLLDDLGDALGILAG